MLRLQILIGLFQICVLQILIGLFQICVPICRLRMLRQIFWLALPISCAYIGAAPDASMAPPPSDGAIGKTMKSHSQKFENCARDSVTVQTGATQQVKLLFIVSPQGKVLNAEIPLMSTPDPDLRSCILRVLRKIEFPIPEDRKQKNITYPLTLRPE